MYCHDLFIIHVSHGVNQGEELDLRDLKDLKDLRVLKI